ncbi:MAG: thioredoxin-disulfide reductase [Candidatus Doudnabacteria bacterium RIFCSPHIGHO2_01_FULL_43_23]|uniref:Thioredoxin reductase n=1 Tax=Candidatus Doudnabacteria bacterium RIFCSPHIGHO2_01_FULL_43_23 TaxID=1817822 RepID=A0A1F5NSL5_9BACT|nr:MAG: thioredoxin-disulfide reductase [Candidatus Doudnabacteria bacterium RIFCSPHIGHO2_01_FULL_43_23]
MYDVIIIGSGPAGLTAALYASRAELATLIIAGLTPGGQLVNTSDVENYPGFEEGIMGPELMDKMLKQSTRFGAKLVNETVSAVDFGKKPFSVTTEKATYESKAIIIASGADAKWLGLENEKRLRGKGVSACATCDGFFFKGKEVVVVGGGDSAMEEALFLTKFATKVTIAHRSDAFRASKIMLNRAKDHPKIELLTHTEIVDVLGKDKVEGVRFKNTQSGEEKDFTTEGLFLAIGHKPNTEIYKGHIELDVKGYIKVHDNTLTSVEGVFTSGDVNDFRYRQAVTAAGMGCMAAIDAEKWLAEQEK